MIKIDFSGLRYLKWVAIGFVLLFVILTTVSFYQLKQANKQLIELTKDDASLIKSLQKSNSQLNTAFADLEFELSEVNAKLDKEILQHEKTKRMYESKLSDYEGRIKALTQSAKNERDAILNEKKNIKYEN